MAPIPVVAAIVFLCIALFLLTFLSSFIRRYSNRHSMLPTATPVSIPIFTTPVTTPISLNRGLDQTVIDTFPTFDYSAVTSSYALECYVCLNEFQADETLRLIPVCDHAFHVGCIGAWLSSNATCPVCRSNLHDAVVITVNSDHQDPPPASVLPKLRRALTWRNVRSGKARLARSKSTGRVADIMERFTLRVPEELRRDIIAGKLRRSRTEKSTLGEESGRRRCFFARSKSMEVIRKVTSSASDGG